MIVSHLLACPECKSKLQQMENSDDLVCEQCAYVLHYNDGIYYCDTSQLSRDAEQTIGDFGKRWNRVFNKMGGLTSFLLPTIEPVKPDFFQDKIILDGGGGFGRLSKILLDYGARHVVLLDASDAVLAARQYLEKYRDRVTIVRGTLIKAPISNEVLDIFFCHGVLHHTSVPQQIIQLMSKALRPDTGAMILWVYAKEGNYLLSKIVKFVGFFSHMAGNWGRWRMADIIDFMLWVLTNLIYRPLVAVGVSQKALWYGNYFLEFLFKPAINNRVDRLQMYHDFISTKIIKYFGKQELEKWATAAGFKKIVFFHFRNQSWAVSTSFNPEESFHK